MKSIKKMVSILVLIIATPILFFIIYNSIPTVSILKAVDFNYDTHILLEEAPDADFSVEEDSFPAKLLESGARETLLNAQGHIRIKEDKIFELLDLKTNDYGRVTIEAEVCVINSERYPNYNGLEGYVFQFVFYSTDQEVCPLKILEYTCLEEKGDVIITNRKKTIYKDIQLPSEKHVYIDYYDVSPHAFWTCYMNDNGVVVRFRSGIEKISGWEAWARSM